MPLWGRSLGRRPLVHATRAEGRRQAVTGVGRSERAHSARERGDGDRRESQRGLRRWRDGRGVMRWTRCIDGARADRVGKGDCPRRQYDASGATRWTLAPSLLDLEGGFLFRSLSRSTASHVRPCMISSCRSLLQRRRRRRAIHPSSLTRSTPFVSLRVPTSDSSAARPW